jgi:hypothetical protein
MLSAGEIQEFRRQLASVEAQIDVVLSDPTLDRADALEQFTYLTLQATDLEQLLGIGPWSLSASDVPF